MTLVVNNIIKTLLKWVSKASLSILDQGLTSGANFIITFFLGRWLNEKEYGVYGIVFTFFLFILGFFISFVFEPMNIFGPSYFNNQLKRYKSILLRIQIIFSLTISGVLLLFTLALYIIQADKLITNTIVGLSIALPMISFYWFARQSCYVDLNPKIAVVGSSIYAFLFIGGSFFLKSFYIISPTMIFIFMGLAGLASGIIITKITGIQFFGLALTTGLTTPNEIIKKHWGYGKWMMGANIANGLGSLAFPMIVGIFLGLNQAGAYRAIQNLFSPLQQIMTALTLLLLPWVSKQFSKGRKHLLHKVVLEIGAVFLFISIVYLFPLNIFGKQIIGFYNKDFYQGFLWVIPLFSIYSLILALTSVYGIVVRALERSDIVMRSKIWSAISVITVGIFLSEEYKLFGTMMILVISVTIESFILIVWELNNEKKQMILDNE